METTADRIKSVDQAAAMVEEILKQGANGLKVKLQLMIFAAGELTTWLKYDSFFAVFCQVVQPFSTCVFLGFEPDPSLNIIARIRGPNVSFFLSLSLSLSLSIYIKMLYTHIRHMCVCIWQLVLSLPCEPSVWIFCHLSLVNFIIFH